MLAREFPDISAEVIMVAHLRAFLQAAVELTPSTLARRQATLRSCFAWAYRNDLLPADPTVKLEPVCLPERNPRPLSEEQVEALLAAIPLAEKRNRLLLPLLYETGMRVGEALGILLPQVQLNDMEGGYIQVIGKGDRERIIPLFDAPRTIRLLRDILKTLGKVGRSSGAICARAVAPGKPWTIPRSTTISSVISKPPGRRNPDCSRPTRK